LWIAECGLRIEKENERVSQEKQEPEQKGTNIGHLLAFNSHSEIRIPK